MIDRTHNNLGYWCSAAVEAYPDHVAVIDLCGEGERKVTYRELEERLSRFARLIGAAGLGPGDRMAMAISNRFEFVEVMYGAMRAGVVPVPLNTKQGPDSLNYIVRNAECRAAVVDPRCSEFAVEVIEGLGDIPRFAFSLAPDGWTDYEAALMAQPPDFDPPEIPDEHPSFQPYTSGSTGRPKGVVLTHAGQLWWIRAVQKYWPSGPDSRTLAAVPLHQGQHRFQPHFGRPGRRGGLYPQTHGAAPQSPWSTGSTAARWELARAPRRKNVGWLDVSREYRYHRTQGGGGGNACDFERIRDCESDKVGVPGQHEP